MKEKILGNTNELKKDLVNGLKMANEKLPDNIKQEFGGAKKAVTVSYILSLIMAFIVNLLAANILLSVLLGIILPKMSVAMQNNIILGASSALVLGLGVFANSNPIMSFYKRLNGFQKPNLQIENRLARIIEPICRKANIPLPNIYIQDVDFVNACALGSDNVAVTLPLLEFDDNIIAGIMAHEIGHLRNLDSVKSIRVCTMNMVLMLFYNIINKCGRVSVMIAKLGSRNVREVFNAVTIFFNFVALFFMFLQIFPEKIGLLLSRQQEYEADAATVEFGQGANFILGMNAIDPKTATVKPGIITRIRYAWGSTHPPTHTRIERVEAAMKI